MKSSSPILLVGLGNPGEEYEKTRHNVGREIVARWAREQGIDALTKEEKFKSLTSEIKVGPRKVIAALPETYMNNSGRAVDALMRYYRIKPHDVWIIHDDMDLPLGMVRIVKNRASAGHRGVESVRRALKTLDFVRFRVGTASGSLAGKKGAKFTKARKKIMIDLLLKPWKKLEEPLFKKAFRKTVEAIDYALKEGVDAAMNEFN